jgi:hypothetical protein
MAVGRAQRMAALSPRIDADFGTDLAQRVVEILTLAEFAWHDCYGEPSPPDEVVDDIFVAAEGDLQKLIQAALLAVVDYRDLRLWADGKRRR